VIMLEPLNALVGEWDTEVSLPGDPPSTVRGRVAFEWLAGGSFLVQRWEVDHPDFPDGIAVIGAHSETDAPFAHHYFDSRGVFRVYEMSLEAGIWKLWRGPPPFWQRYIGELNAEADVIAGRWEKSSDGSTWEHDFDFTCTKIS
jgi:hypothetical protein